MHACTDLISLRRIDIFTVADLGYDTRSCLCTKLLPVVLTALCPRRCHPHSGEGKTVVTIICDGGARYASTVFNPEWLKEKGLAPTPGVHNMHDLSFISDA